MYHTQEERIAQLEARVNQLARIVESQNRRLAALSGAPQPHARPAYPTQRMNATPPASTRPARSAPLESRAWDDDPEMATLNAAVARSRGFNGR